MILIKWINPFYSAYMLQSKLGNWLDNKPDEIHFKWVDYSQISKEMILAVVASEDQLYPDHWGFDLKQISETIDDYQKGKGLRGASTITQQVAKNMFLWQGRSLIRKGLEAYFTILLETICGKERIMEIYLNIIELGPMLFGVEAAAQNYYKKNSKTLNRYQSALFAAVLPNPIRFKVNRPSNYIKTRQQEIIDNMRSLGGIAYINSL